MLTQNEDSLIAQRTSPTISRRLLPDNFFLFIAYAIKRHSFTWVYLLYTDRLDCFERVPLPQVTEADPEEGFTPVCA